ncbi:VCBS repeat-containing protein [Candidatus Woesearchaeota archaeon]|nr:VCBS repeat-containing protein [Candidatus Woesearchaeota archaeon]
MSQETIMDKINDGYYSKSKTERILIKYLAKPTKLLRFAVKKIPALLTGTLLATGIIYLANSLTSTDKNLKESIQNKEYSKTIENIDHVLEDQSLSEYLINGIIDEDFSKTDAQLAAINFSEDDENNFSFFKKEFIGCASETGLKKITVSGEDYLIFSNSKGLHVFNETNYSVIPKIKLMGKLHVDKNEKNKVIARDEEDNIYEIKFNTIPESYLPSEKISVTSRHIKSNNSDISNIILDDINGDGEEEILYTDRESNFSIISQKGITISKHKYSEEENNFLYSPLIVDVDKDGNKDVVVNSDYQTHIIYLENFNVKNILNVDLTSQAQFKSINIGNKQYFFGVDDEVPTLYDGLFSKVSIAKNDFEFVSTDWKEKDYGLKIEQVNGEYINSIVHYGDYKNISALNIMQSKEIISKWKTALTANTCYHSGPVFVKLKDDDSHQVMYGSIDEELIILDKNSGKKLMNLKLDDDLFTDVIKYETLNGKKYLMALSEDNIYLMGDSWFKSEILNFKY